MGRDIQINGEALIRVRFGDHISPLLSNIIGAENNLSELGLSSDAITISPNYFHYDVKVDDFGPNVPAEILWQLSDCNIRMTLVHYDPNILDICMSESMGGIMPIQGLDPLDGFAGQMQPCGTPMMGGTFFLPTSGLLASGYHFISLNILSPQAQQPWRFPASYLASPPVVIPLGTEKSLVNLNWRAIPYSLGQQMSIMSGTSFGSGITMIKEIVSSGAKLWDHLTDQPTED